MASVLAARCRGHDCGRPTEEIVALDTLGTGALAARRDVQRGDRRRRARSRRSWQLGRDALPRRRRRPASSMASTECVPTCSRPASRSREDLRTTARAERRDRPDLADDQRARGRAPAAHQPGRARARAADGILDADEQSAVLREGRRIGRRRAVDRADLPLIDEAEALIAGPPRRYGHVVVDEAQDLSAMALRVLGRRAGAAAVDDDPRRPRAGHRPRGRSHRGRTRSPPRAAAPTPSRGARDRLPGARPDPRDGQPAAPRGRPAGAPVAIGACARRAAGARDASRRTSSSPPSRSEVAALDGRLGVGRGDRARGVASGRSSRRRAAAERLGERPSPSSTRSAPRVSSSTRSWSSSRPLIYREVNGARLLYVR